MAGKRSLNAKNLEALGAPALAQLLLDVSSGNAVIQRRLRLALAAAEGAAGAAQEVRKRLAATARATTFVDSRKRKALLSDLEAQLQAITGPIAEADPTQGFQLLVRFLELADGVIERSSDTTGTLIGVFLQGVESLAAVASAAALKPGALAEQIAELISGNGYGQFNELIPTMASALGEQGLTQLQQHFETIGGPDAGYALRQIAEARGDVDAYMAQFDARTLSRPAVAADVALHLLEAGRAQDGLAILDGAAANVSDWLATEWGDARIAVLEALGRHEDAQQQRWDLFCRSLSAPHLRDYLKRLDDFSDVEAEERAIEVAEQHPQPLLALAFLMHWPALPRAARYVLSHPNRWDGEAFDVLAPAADRLSSQHPLAAIVLLRSMVVFALWNGRSKRYRYAAEHLQTCERLAAEIDDWQGLDSQASFMGRLREAYGRSRSFWQLVER